ncbi:MAG TPA: YfcC family protein, partial [Brevibacterium sp.]|nr:YfcC family protein [Brevibacterium sp.]
INTGLGQAISDLEPFSGAPLRLVLLVALLTVGILYVMRYARRVQLDPSLSLLHADPVEEEKRRMYAGTGQSAAPKLSARQKTAAWLILPFAALLVWGILTQGWFFLEISGLLIMMGIVVGLAAGLTTTELCEAFNRGLRDVLVGAIIVGVARSVAVILEDGQIMDTIVYGLGILVGSFPPVLSAIGMYISQSLFNFIVPSGSGQALVTMPIMAPLSDVVGVTRQTAVLSYQLGDGLTNIIYPTSGYFMAVLAIGKVRWEKWVRFFLPLLGLWVIVAIGFLVFAQATQWNG